MRDRGRRLRPFAGLAIAAGLATLLALAVVLRFGGPSGGLAPGTPAATAPRGPSAEDDPARAGAALFLRLGCVTCHVPAGQGRGPALRGLAGSRVTLEGGGAVVADDAYLRESILDPTARIVQGYAPIMPSYRGVLDEAELAALIAYLGSLAPVNGG